MDTIESDKNVTLADLNITVSKSYLYCQITHLYIFEVHTNFARTGINFPPKKEILPGNSELLGNYWVICNLALIIKPTYCNLVKTNLK